MSSHREDVVERLEYPVEWLTHSLLPDDVLGAQRAEIQGVPPGRVCGSEHYRYAAFCHWTRNPNTPESVLRRLIQAAEKDPEPVMAQAALIDLVAHPNCSVLAFDEAVRVFQAFPQHYFDVEQLRRARREGLPSWKQ